MPSAPVVAVAPVGDTSRRVVGAVARAVREPFEREVVLAPGVQIPDCAYHPGRRQFLSTALLDALARLRRPGWERLLGVADVDLFVPELNFVFGEADPRRGVAVFSVNRLRWGLREDETGDRMFERRVAVEAIHELGHTYGLGHCSDPHCVMWFSNTLAESDRKGTAFCPAHTGALGAALHPRRRS
jgi:archaemetzincin